MSPLDKSDLPTDIIAVPECEKLRFFVFWQKKLPCVLMQYPGHGGGLRSHSLMSEQITVGVAQSQKSTIQLAPQRLNYVWTSNVCNTLTSTTTRKIRIASVAVRAVAEITRMTG